VVSQFGIREMINNSKPIADARALLLARASDTEDWLQENAPRIRDEQRHLDAGTDARAYWHYGYLMALVDALSLIGTRIPRN